MRLDLIGTRRGIIDARKRIESYIVVYVNYTSHI